MKDPLGSISQSLARKLIITVGILIIGGGSFSSYTLISNNKKNLMKNAVEYTASYSDLVKKSLRYNMLVFNREPIQHTIEGIGSTEGIKNIRIFDSRGKIFYSSKKTEVGRFVDRSSFSCAGCHSEKERPSEVLADSKKWATYRDSKGSGVLTFVDPIYNEVSCSASSCHVHSPSQKVLGILETDFSIASLDRNIQQQAFNTMVYAIAIIGLSAAILYFVLRRFVLTPIKIFSRSMKKVAKGDLDQTISITSHDEMGMLADSFNVMTRDLKTAKDKVDNWTQTLESEIAKKTDELKRSQNKLIQAEKLAAVGRLTSDVAHRIRNPLTSIGGFAHKLEKIAESSKEREYAGIIGMEVSRLEKILRDVLVFSDETRFRSRPHSIEDVIHDVTTLHKISCEEQAVQMTTSVEENLPPVLMDSNQAKLILSNVIVNALEAMPDGGSLSIRGGSEILHQVKYLYIKVSDSGRGIPESKMPLIFEPFFSTKEGNGTGLGLSIARKFMEGHGGFIRAESAVGKGSTFSLYFPSYNDAATATVKCWELMKCGRNNDSAIKCPAYPHYGTICWAVAGTFCEGKVQGTFAQKYENCRKCKYYRKTNGDGA